MDRGAHFYQCDFQVHTPRDRQWTGQTAVTDEERRMFARELIAACRSKDIQAIAITDHQDMALVFYVREAALSETDSSGALVDPSLQIVVFPGMELTLGVPCQALLVFDANFPEDLFSLATTALAITASDNSEQHTALTVRLDHITSLAKLHEELDKHSYLRGRYIALPNVSEGGTSTLLRAGHGGHYQGMPCVGGYLDGHVGQLGDGNKRILNGLDSNYGNKAIGLFQTSDNRQRDFAVLGQHATWVKWAEPTAEALRQACLARQTRLSYAQPLLPSAAITALNVSNSAFMGPVFLELNSQYNALIGGRGTGKSTLLEYLRWGLCDQTPHAVDAEDFVSEQVRRRKLADQTLTPLKAVVDVHVIVNGVPHVVRRHSATNELSLKIGSGAFEPCKEVDVRGLLPVQAYSQKQLSGVGVRLEELRRFVHAPVRKQLEGIQAQLVSTGSEIRRAYALVRAKHLKQRDLEKEERELRSLTEQTTSIRNALTGITPTDQTIIQLHSAHEREAEIARLWTDNIRQAETALGDAFRVLEKLPAFVAPEEIASLPQNEVIETMRVALIARIRDVEQAVAIQVEGLQALHNSVSPYGNAAARWGQEHEKFHADYGAAKARSTSQQSKLAELDRLEARSAAIRSGLATRRSEIAALGEPERDLNLARDRWCQLHEQRSQLLAEQCQRLAELSGGQIRATLASGAVIDPLVERLKALLTGTNIRGAKIEDLCRGFSAADSPVRQAQQAMTELEVIALLDLDTTAEAQLPLTPLLTAAGFTPRELLRIAGKLSPDVWVDICTTQMEDQPSFEYRVREQEYIAFANASAGQQATALLWALLNQEGPPLLIDQPEDDLDNQVLLKVVEQIWHAKQRRQLIFASHNANVVVNGDADLVVCCDYRVTGEQAGGAIKIQGAIDVPQVRDEIATVMEGGKAAFRLRKEKYGF